MATQFNFNWTPAPGTAAQDVDYKRDIDVVWLKGAEGLGPAINQAQLNAALEDNRVYNWRVVNHCSGGGDFLSAVRKAIKFTCPALTITKTNQSVTVAFAHLGASINQYVIKLYDSTGTQLQDSRTVNGVIPATISETLTGLQPNTTYKVRVEVYATELFKNDCALESVTTNAGSGCAVPVITGATIS